jgi:hypothetical protein
LLLSQNYQKEKDCEQEEKNEIVLYDIIFDGGAKEDN